MRMAVEAAGQNRRKIGRGVISDTGYSGAGRRFRRGDLNFRDVLLSVLDRVHGGVGGAQQAVFCVTFLRVESKANAGRSIQLISTHGERTVEAVIEPGNDFVQVREAVVE